MVELEHFPQQHRPRSHYGHRPRAPGERDPQFGDLYIRRGRRLHREHDARGTRGRQGGVPRGERGAGRSSCARRKDPAHRGAGVLRVPPQTALRRGVRDRRAPQTGRGKERRHTLHPAHRRAPLSRRPLRRHGQRRQRARRIRPHALPSGEFLQGEDALRDGALHREQPHRILGGGDLLLPRPRRRQPGHGLRGRGEDRLARGVPHLGRRAENSGRGIAAHRHAGGGTPRHHARFSQRGRLPRIHERRHHRSVRLLRRSLRVSERIASRQPAGARRKRAAKRALACKGNGRRHDRARRKAHRRRIERQAIQRGLAVLTVRPLKLQEQYSILQ